jgi:hypothetical protein
VVTSKTSFTLGGLTVVTSVACTSKVSLAKEVAMVRPENAKKMSHPLHTCFSLLVRLLHFGFTFVGLTLIVWRRWSSLDSITQISSNNSDGITHQTPISVPGLGWVLKNSPCGFDRICGFLTNSLDCDHALWHRWLYGSPSIGPN